MGRHAAKNRIDITGLRYGRLVAVRCLGAAPSGARWECRCDCGGVAVVVSLKLRRGLTASCGCLQREKTSAANRTHGRRRTAEYRIWHHLRQRCQNPSDAAFADYGGRGIAVCERWSDFANFLADMGLRPSGRHTLDRRDNDGPYSKYNCRWATKKQQARNRRSNKIVVYQGQRMSLAEACSLRGVKYSIVNSRLHRGWSFRRAMTTPPRGEL